MINEFGILFWCFAFAVIAFLFGASIGYMYGRQTMLNEIYGRRRSSILRRSLRRLDDAVKAAKIAASDSDRVHELEAIQ